MVNAAANREAWRECAVANAVLARQGDRAAREYLGENFAEFSMNDQVVICQRCLKELPLIDMEPTLDGARGTITLAAVRQAVTARCMTYVSEDVPPIQAIINTNQGT